MPIGRQGQHLQPDRLDDLHPARTAATVTVPYTMCGAAGYLDTTRCNVQGGCSGSGGVDTIGVKITYPTRSFTPMGSFIGLGTSNYTLVESNAMRMEPVL